VTLLPIVQHHLSFFQAVHRAAIDAVWIGACVFGAYMSLTSHRHTNSGGRDD
jgi:hypothetical protein